MVTIDITSLLDFFKDQMHDVLKGMKDEGDHFFKGELKSYLSSQKQKFITTKTFLHRHDTIEFDKVYFNVSLRSSRYSKLQLNNVSELFKEKNFLTVIGQAGSGKSMLMKKVFLSALVQKFKIPIFIELRQLNYYEGNLESYIKEKLLKNDLSPSNRILDRMLKKGSFLFIFDGFDELFSKTKENLTFDLNNFVDLFNSNYYLLTSRPGANIDLLPRFNNAYVNNLDDTEVLEFISQQISIYNNSDREELISRITQTIQQPENTAYKIYLKNPLLLSMFILTYESNPEIPKRKSTFYSNVYNALCIQHNSISKLGYVHEKKSNLSNDEIEEILQIFSFSTYFQGENGFTHSTLKKYLSRIDRNEKVNIKFDSGFLIEDLTVAIPILLKDGVEYKFLHRSLQEYFAAKFISLLEREQKELVYKKKFKQLALQGTDSFNNFWTLCRDLDKNSFLEFFIFDSLDRFMKKVNSDSEVELIKKLLDLINLQLTIEFYTFKEKNIYGDTLASSTDRENGELTSSKWSGEFNHFKNIFQFLSFFKMYKLTESIPLGLLFKRAENTLACEQLEEMKLDTEAQRYQISVNQIYEISSIIENTKFYEELLILIDNIEDSMTKIRNEISEGIGFNDDIINELLN